MLLNCIIEESDSIRAASDPDSVPEVDDMEFRPRNKDAIDLRDLPVEKLRQTLQETFGSPDGDTI